ncbi:MAG: hypothetical protein U0587_18065 [Candidatus Binatia bacterium]
MALVESNPIATAEQHEVERQALQLVQHPLLRRTREEVRARWLEAVTPNAEMRACFDAAFAEVMFGAAVWSLNQDPQHPKVVTISRLPHKLGDLDVPGSRWGLDNPDSIYRVIPIDGNRRYLIHGRVAERRLVENYFTLWDRKMNTVDVLSGHDLLLNPDRTFTISVDSDPPAGRPNHVRSNPQAHEFYIRDVILDWARDRPNVFRIEELDGPSNTPPRGTDAQAELTAQFMRTYADNTVRWNRQALEKPVNTFRFTIDRDTDGALRNQIYILGHFHLGNDEVLVLSVRTGGARYFVAPITNLWGTTNDIVTRTGSLNLAQSVANADGTYTYVVAVDDPGVHNWVDPCGMRTGILTLRWAEFPSGRPGPDVGVDSTVVSLGQLRKLLPPGSTWMTPAERGRQLAERARAYRWRLLDH